MMFPQMGSVFFNWSDAVQMKVVHQQPDDFELFEDVVAVETFEAVIQAMRSKEVMRKSEDLRIWKWWTMWSTHEFRINTVVQDPNGVEFRIQSTEDWSQGGFFVSEMTEQPRGL